MVYKRITVVDVWEIIRRWHAGYTLSHVARCLGDDCKTVRKYIHLAEQLGMSRDKRLPAREETMEKLLEALPERHQPKPV